MRKSPKSSINAPTTASPVLFYPPQRPLSSGQIGREKPLKYFQEEHPLRLKHCGTSPKLKNRYRRHSINIKREEKEKPSAREERKDLKATLTIPSMPHFSENLIGSFVEMHKRE
jgi:hypothetical protein